MDVVVSGKHVEVSPRADLVSKVAEFTACDAAEVERRMRVDASERK